MPPATEMKQIIDVFDVLFSVGDVRAQCEQWCMLMVSLLLSMICCQHVEFCMYIVVVGNSGSFEGFWGYRGYVQDREHVLRVSNLFVASQGMEKIWGEATCLRGTTKGQQ